MVYALCFCILLLIYTTLEHGTHAKIQIPKCGLLNQTSGHFLAVYNPENFLDTTFKWTRTELSV